jgi:hypothetical protein
VSFIGKISTTEKRRQKQEVVKTERDRDREEEKVDRKRDREREMSESWAVMIYNITNWPRLAAVVAWGPATVQSG